MGAHSSSLVYFFLLVTWTVSWRPTAWRSVTRFPAGHAMMRVPFHAKEVPFEDAVCLPVRYTDLIADGSLLASRCQAGVVPTHVGSGTISALTSRQGHATKSMCFIDRTVKGRVWSRGR